MEKKILKNYITFSVGTWLSLILSFFSTPITSHLISPEEFGKSSLFFAVYSLILTVLLSGTINSLMRFYYKYGNKSELFYSTIIIPLIGANFIVFFLIILKEQLSRYFGFESAKFFSAISIFLILSGIVQQYMLTLVRVEQRGMLYSLLNILAQVISLSVTVLYCLFIAKTFYSIILAQLISYLIVSLIGISLLRDSIKHIKINLSITKEVFNYGYPFLFSGIIWWVVSGTDKLMIKFYSDFYQLGLYSAANKLVTGMLAFTTGFNTMWYPYIYERYEREGEKVKDRISKVFNYVSFIFITLSITIMLFKDVVFLMFAKHYRQAASISPFLLTYPAVITMATVVARAIDFQNKTFWFIVSDTFGAVMNVLLNFLLIPLLKAKGAAVASGISYLSVFLLEYIISQKVFYVDYDRAKMGIGISLLYISAFMNTFFSKSRLSLLLNVSFILALFIIYKKECTKLIKSTKELIDSKKID